MQLIFMQRLAALSGTHSGFFNVGTNNAGDRIAVGDLLGLFLSSSISKRVLDTFIVRSLKDLTGVPPLLPTFVRGDDAPISSFSEIISTSFLSCSFSDTGGAVTNV